MEPRVLADRLESLQVVDVRYPNEWEAGHIDGALHIPGDYLADRVDELDRKRPVVTVCRTGSRSADAAEWLRDEGFGAENLDGGMVAWADAGLPFVAAGGGPGTVAEPEPPADDRPPEDQELQNSLLEVIFAAHEHFGDHEPTEEQMLAFLRDRLIAEGKTPAEADRFLAEMGSDPT